MARTKETQVKLEALTMADNNAKQASARPSAAAAPPADLAASRKRPAERAVPPDRISRSLASRSSAAAAPSSAAAAPSSPAAASSSAAAAGPSRSATVLPLKTVTLVEPLRVVIETLPQLEYFLVYVMNRLNKVDELVKVQYERHQALTETAQAAGRQPTRVQTNQLLHV